MYIRLIHIMYIYYIYIINNYNQQYHFSSKRYYSVNIVCH